MEGNPEQIMAEHIKRVFTPIKPGLQYVRTEDFRDYFEEMEDLDDLSPEMHERAYEEAVKCVDIVQESIMEQLQYDARRFIEEGGEDPGWRSANAGTMKTTLAAFCDLNIGMWEDEFFPQYKEANPEVLDEAGFEYVKSFIGSALAVIPNHIEDGDESIYYDSDATDVHNSP